MYCLPGEEFSETSRRSFGEGAALVTCRHLNTEMWCTLLFLRMQEAVVVLFCAGIAALLHRVAGHPGIGMVSSASIAASFVQSPVEPGFLC